MPDGRMGGSTLRRRLFGGGCRQLPRLDLAESGIRETAARAVPKADLRAALKEKNLSMAKVARLAGVAESTVNAAGKGEAILKEKAEQIAKAAGIPFENLFTADERDEPLSSTSILAYHRFIHIVLAQAEREMLVPYNAADKATPPQKEKSEVGTFQTAELIAIGDAAAKEPIKRQMLIHLLLLRRRPGEHFQTAWSCPGQHHGQYLRPCNGGGRPAQCRHSVQHFFEKGLNLRGELN